MHGRHAMVLVLGACIVAASAHAGDMVSEPDFTASVRALFLLQDNIAAGRKAAIDSQQARIAQIAARFGQIGHLPIPDERNAMAALGYVLAGGPPGIAEDFSKAEKLPPTLIRLLEVAVLFKNGHKEEASKLLEPIDPLALHSGIGGRVALVKAMLTSDDEPARKLAYFDLAIQLMPGTLVEESALRRAALFAGSRAEFRPLWKNAGRYLRRFQQSPYAAEFISSLMTSVVGLEAKNKKADRTSLQNLVDQLPTEKRRSAYLLLAQKATYAGLPELAIFSAQRAKRFSLERSYEWQRAELYEAVHSIAGDGYENSMDHLRQVNAEILDGTDRQLLSAALKMGRAIRAPADYIATGSANGSPPDNIPADHTALVNRAAEALKSANKLLERVPNDQF